jgi:hypothetical protein
MPRYHASTPEAAFIIEVTSGNINWTAMASEWGGIMRELESAPQPCEIIMIYEWRLHWAVNPQEPQDKFPTWKRHSVKPWTLEKPSRGSDR